EIIRPILRGRDIKRYGYDFADLWLINTHNGIKENGVSAIDIEQYPAIKRHLDNYYPQLAKRLDKGDTPYNLRNCAYMEDFSKQKIVWGEISDKTKFSIELSGNFMTEATTFLMTGDSLLYLVVFLNSKLSEYVFSKIGTTTGVGTVRWKKFTIEQLFVPKLSALREEEFNEISRKILRATEQKQDYLELKKLVDNMIYSDFNFIREEIDFIESQ
uniref:TaqI-like C-terminal specificity domain-containing protein n=1 Tax=Albibacterium indicum TaxID=2292082 RepID=UPI00197EEE60